MPNVRPISETPQSLKKKNTDRTRYNALRHGLTAQVLIMSDEDRRHYDIFLANTIDELAPVGQIETSLATAIAEHDWRLKSIRARCNNIVALGQFDGTQNRFATEHPEIQNAVTDAITTAEHSEELVRLSLYEQRTQRAWKNAMTDLKQVQADREAKLLKQQESARSLLYYHKLRDLPWQPADDNFVFSTDEIEYNASRFHREALGKRDVYRYRGDFFPCDVPRKREESE